MELDQIRIQAIQERVDSLMRRGQRRVSVFVESGIHRTST